MKGLVDFSITEGNPGALTFLMEAYTKTGNPIKAELAFQRMRNAGITGPRLYMLWNDCCGRDTDQAISIMTEKDITIILHHIDDGKGYGIPFKKVEDSDE